MRLPRQVALLTLGLAVLALVSCGEPRTSRAQKPSQEPDDKAGPPPSVLLLTVEGLRADAVAGLLERQPRRSFTPHLDQLIAEASWAGRGVAASPSPGPAVASVLTGLLPWSHQVLEDRQPLDRQVFTLAEALQERGYATTAYVSGGWLSSAHGFEQGFDTFRAYGGGGRARGHLETLGANPQFVWVHFTEPEPPYRLPGPLARQGRKTISRQDLEPFRDPSIELPESQRREIWRAYLQHVLLLDHRIGGLLDALRSSATEANTLIAVAAVHGEEFGEHGQIGNGNNLGRVVLDVPIIVRLPASQMASLRIEPGERPSILRLWSTILETAGGEPEPTLPPSLFREGRGGALSELFRANGSRSFSWVEGEVQVIRDVGPTAGPAVPFSASPARTRLWIWEGRGARELRRDGSKQRLEKRLETEWSRFLDRERTLDEERFLWSHG